jgi:small subunit ribosomal protein S18
MGIRPKKEKMRPRSRECAFCKANVEPVWSDVERLAEYLSPRSRILKSSFTGVCVKHQRQLAVAIKQSRHLALLPFTSQE